MILYFNEEATAASHETLVSGDVGGDWVGIIGPVCWGMLSSPGSPSEGAQSTLAAVLHSSCLSGPKASERGEELASRMYLGQCGSEFSHVMLAITLDKRVTPHPPSGLGVIADCIIFVVVFAICSVCVFPGLI